MNAAGSSGTADWGELATARVKPERLVEILELLVNTPSATGEEGPLARQICAELKRCNISADEQVIDEHQSNAVGRVAGHANGGGLLLYSPIDTVTANNAAEDLPWVGETLRDDMRANAWHDDAHVFGLGAQNPKGHAACVLAAGEAIVAAGVPLKRDLFLGFGAGGMPTNARAGLREGSGHGVGCQKMLGRLPELTSAVIAKSGRSVSWEEVGLAWISVRVMGTHSYVGSRHLLPFRNAIDDAGRLIHELENWFEQWGETHRSGLVAPQGVVSHIESGWSRMPAFTPAECRFQLDLRVSPRTSAEELDAEFGAKFQQLCSQLGVDAQWQRTVFIPGTTTPQDADVIQRCINAWEKIEQEQHTAVAGLSGATDANILRLHGVPTARVGLIKADLPDIDFQLGMNAADISDLCRLSRLLIEVAVSHCLEDDGVVT